MFMTGIYFSVTSYEEEYDESSISPPKKSHKKHKEKVRGVP